ncbi:MAG: sulfotransferase family 2 domain-containing protein [Nocardioides sp.]|nr:sulfotransferase family 2 domain-containing protein [Nocardioidaceae bacterium]MCB8956041.1 sulfotransferase family 2 domain-containing protein [Nocardioides sp.]
MTGPEISAEVFRTEPERRTRLTAEARQALRQLARPGSRSGELSPSAYNLTISHAHRFMWFRVAKVATRTLLGYFEDHGVALDVDHAYRMRYPTALFADYFKFGFVRHPLPRFVSTWQDKVVNANYFDLDDDVLGRVRERPEAFAAWVADQDLTVADQHLALQTRLIDLTQVDFLGRLETFDADFALVCRRLGLPVAAAAPRHRTATARTPEMLGSAELQSAVADLYRLDYQVLGYDPAGL